MKRFLSDTRFLMVVAVLLVFASGVGCVKEEGSPIYQENDDTVSEMASGQSVDADAPTVKYQAPERWTDTVEKDGLKIVVDADVVVPEGNFQTTMIAREEISQETADRIRTTLLGDAVLYQEYPPAAPYTKREIQDTIDARKDYLDTLGTDKNPDTEESLGYDPREVTQMTIDALEEMYEKAPDTFAPGPSDTQFHEVNHLEGSKYYTSSVIEGTAELGEGRGKALLRIVNGPGSGFAYFYPEIDIEPFDPLDPALSPMRYVESGVPLKDAGISMEEAREKALRTVQEMGLDYLEVSSVQDEMIIERDMSTGGMGEATGVRPCYTFYLTRSIGGMTENYATSFGILPAGKTDEDADIGPREFVQITIAKEGIVYFIWRDSTKIVGTQNENAALLKFTDIQDLFNSQVPMVNAESYLQNTLESLNGVVISGRTIAITEARLGLMCVSLQGQEDDEYLMVPVWDFYGYEALKLQNPEAARRVQLSVNENGEHISGNFEQSVLTLNAIDGSVISRDLGY